MASLQLRGCSLESLVPAQSSRIRGRVVPGLHRMQKFPSGYSFQSSSTRREIMYITAVSQCILTNASKSDETSKSQSQQLHAFRFKPPQSRLKLLFACTACRPATPSRSCTAGDIIRVCRRPQATCRGQMIPDSVILYYLAPN